jgi:ATP-dependent RNA helicase DeaD
MSSPDHSELLGAELSSALANKGYASLTQVQQAVLDPAFSDRDLRISSQTGSGKTLALGFAMRHVVKPAAKPADGVARPYAVVIVPTRELAKQVEAELGWLYAPSKALVASVIGGASVRDEFRLLARGPAVVVGTPGRLLDHLTRGAIDLAQTGVLVLDEADHMLDLGFREDLEAILARAPEDRRTHLVSATFPREVEALARRFQSNAALIHGTPLGTANSDIEHVVHLVKPNERIDALINLLLAAPDEQVLAFARTRADVAEACEVLHEAGFAVDSLSGEMEQQARQRALSAFKRGKLQVLVATDVAARGIDHQDIARVVQLEPPNDAETYTHRSGRTGRAGRKGKSSIMVQPAGLPRLTALLKRAGVRFRVVPIPSAESIATAQDEKLVTELTQADAGVVAADGTAETEANVTKPREAGERARNIAARLLASGGAERALAVLIERLQTDGICAPRTITEFAQLPQRNGHAVAARAGRPREMVRPPRRTDARAAHPPQGRGGVASESWVRFRVSWGQAQGADARRLLPMLCRRGNIRGADIGSIQLTPSFSLVDVATRVAADFERATRLPDPRDPTVTVRRDNSAQASSDERGGRRHRAS